MRHQSFFSKKRDSASTLFLTSEMKAPCAGPYRGAAFVLALGFEDAAAGVDRL